jgi:hypothetical protein
MEGRQPMTRTPLRLRISSFVNMIRRRSDRDREAADNFRFMTIRNHDAALDRIMELESRSPAVAVEKMNLLKITRNHEAALIRIMELESQVRALKENVDALEAASPTVLDLRGPLSR